GSDEIEIVLPLQALLDDFHVQHPEEATAETEAERVRALRLEKQGRVVECQLVERRTEVFIIIGRHRKQARIHLRLNPLETWQRGGTAVRGMRNGIADRRAMNILDSGDDKSD